MGFLYRDAWRLDALDGIAFVTDRHGKILNIGSKNWDRFAHENNAPELESHTVVGRSLFDYISGEEVRQQTERVLRHVAESPDARWVLPYRCDAPGERRNMRLAVTPIFVEGLCYGFLFQSIELSAQERPPIDLYDFAAVERRAGHDMSLPLIKMCSWCQRVHSPTAGGDEWIAAEQYYATGGNAEVRITHGICDTCLENNGMEGDDSVV